MDQLVEELQQVRRSSPTIPVLLSACALLIGACARTDAEPVEAGEPQPTAPPVVEVDDTTPEPGAPAVWPLTGLPLDDPAGLERPAVVVKVDNHPDARPHTGLTAADVVYELQVEGITRFAAVFHSQDANPVGPVRSARSSDPNLVGNLGGALLVWSGGNDGVTYQVKQAEQAKLIVDVSHTIGEPHYFRGKDRKAPHNLYAWMSDLRDEFTPEGAKAPPRLFAYRGEGEPVHASAQDGHGVVIHYEGSGNSMAEYVWDPARSCYGRYQLDDRHGRGDAALRDVDGEHVCPQNVVVLLTEYTASAADSRSPEALSIGSGDGWVLTEGRAIPVRWTREVAIARTTLVSEDGSPVTLTPGRTWVALPSDAGSTVELLDSEAAAHIRDQG